MIELISLILPSVIYVLFILLIPRGSGCSADAPDAAFEAQCVTMLLSLMVFS